VSTGPAAPLPLNHLDRECCGQPRGFDHRPLLHNCPIWERIQARTVGVPPVQYKPSKGYRPRKILEAGLLQPSPHFAAAPCMGFYGLPPGKKNLLELEALSPGPDRALPFSLGRGAFKGAGKGPFLGRVPPPRPSAPPFAQGQTQREITLFFEEQHPGRASSFSRLAADRPLGAGCAQLSRRTPPVSSNGESLEEHLGAISNAIRRPNVLVVPPQSHHRRPCRPRRGWFGPPRWGELG